MSKKYKVCDCFFDVTCYFLHTNADFVTFKKIYKKNFNSAAAAVDVDNGIFCILKVELNAIGATYIACCRNLLEFQICECKFASPDRFPLASIACNYAERRCFGDADFDYRVDQFEVYYNDDDEYYNSDGSEFNDDEAAFRRAVALNSSICYTDMRLGLLRFTRFCSVCQQIFLLYFDKNLHIFEKNLTEG